MSVSTSGFINSGLICHLDAYKYSGTGTTWTDLTKTYNGTLVGTPPYTHMAKTGITFANKTLNYGPSPDGGNNSTRVWNTPSVGSYFTFHNGSLLNTVIGQTYTFSFYGKADGPNSLLFLESWSTNYCGFNVNLNTQTIYGQRSNVIASSVTNAGNGWYRYSVTSTPNTIHGLESVMYVGAYGSTATQHYAQVYGFHIEYGTAVPFTPSFMFDGSSQSATLSIPDSFWNSTSWTVSTWVNFNLVNRGNDNSIIGHGGATNNNGLHLVERGAKAYIGFFNNDLSGAITLVANTWYNIVYSFDFSTKVKTLYVNGVFDVSGGTVGYGGTGSNTTIGRHTFDANGQLFGLLSSVSFYNRALTATEISLNYKSTKGRYLQ